MKDKNELMVPEDFMFQLTKEEFENLKSQSTTSSWDCLLPDNWTK